MSIKKLSLAIQAELSTYVDKLFKKNNAELPILVWNPDKSMMIYELQILLDYYNSLNNGNIPHYNTLDPLKMPVEILGYLMILEVLDSGELRYRLYGSNIAEMSKFDMTGKTVSTIDTSPFIPKFFMAGYNAVIRRKEILLTYHVPPKTVDVCDWTRLILPLVDDTGNISRLLVGNIPGGYRD